MGPSAQRVVGGVTWLLGHRSVASARRAYSGCTNFKASATQLAERCAKACCQLSLKALPSNAKQVTAAGLQKKEPLYEQPFFI